MCLCAESISRVRGAPSITTSSPSAPSPRSGAFLLEANSSADSLRVPSLNLSTYIQTHLNKEANMQKKAASLWNTVSLLYILESQVNFFCLVLMHTLTTAQPPPHPRFSHRPSYAQWTSGFLISAVVNQHGWALRRMCRPWLKLSVASSQLCPTYHPHNMNKRSHLLEEGCEGQCLVKVCEYYESSRIGWIWGETDVVFVTERDAPLTGQPEGLWSL